MMIMFEHAAKIGVPVAFGTDAGVEPHGSNAREFTLMHQNGFTAAQCLMAATHGGADLLGVDDITGSLEAGKAADVVAVPGNPLEDISDHRASGDGDEGWRAHRGRGKLASVVNQVVLLSVRQAWHSTAVASMCPFASS